MDKGMFVNNLKKDLDSVKSDVAEIKEYTAEMLGLVRQAWGAGTLGEVAKDLREAIARLNSLSRAEGNGAALDSAAKFTEKCEMITNRLDHITRSMDARYGRTWAHPLLRHAVKTGAAAIIALAGVGMYHVWLLVRAAIN